jgi:pimeloyl-ACP methyl ester carboxylesterase
MSESELPAATEGTTMADREATRRRCAELLQGLLGRYDPTVMDLRGGSARIRLEVEGVGEWDAFVGEGRIGLREADPRREPDALIGAGPDVWESMAADVRAGMVAFRSGRLRVRTNLHLGIGLLAATSGDSGPARLRFERVGTSDGELSYITAGAERDEDPILCIHGLGGTKVSFMPTIDALADYRRVIALDLLGFGDSDKPITAAYDAPYFARAVAVVMDELALERVHLVGNSMGGRVAIELALREPGRVASATLLSPALAWLRQRPLRGLLSLPLAKLGLIQPAPRRFVEPIVRSLVPGGAEGWTAAGVDEFLRAYLTPAGRHAFYESARRIYLDEPRGAEGLWPRLRDMQAETLFVWGTEDTLVPLGFRKHVERVLPAARHVELDCGHVPQLERPRQTHRAIRELIEAVERR